ncbi:MAG: YwiC-like family protein [Chloroflexi bacterium]|nr:YwiC-like family protein [Chloroflexota bacterium]
MQSYLRRQIALPQDHGSWVFILSPLLVGLFAGGRFTAASLALVIAAMAAFLIRQPVTMAVKAYAGRRPRTDLPAARFWIILYGTVILLALGYLIVRGFTYVLFLAVPGAPVFAWHLILVSKRAERRQAGVEILATGVLALAAPAAYWVGLGHYAAEGWWLWLWTWLQSSGSIVYAYLRLEQRERAALSPSKGLTRSEGWQMGQRAFLYTSFNLALALILGWIHFQPQWIFLPFLVQWAETVWGVTHPAVGWKPTAIGIRQLIVSTLWTILFILCWR